MVTLRNHPEPEANGSSWEELPTPEARGGSWEEPPMPEGRAGGREEQSEEWWLGSTGGPRGAIPR